jgi:hypothetical protein
VPEEVALLEVVPLVLTIALFLDQMSILGQEPQENKLQEDELVLPVVVLLDVASKPVCLVDEYKDLKVYQMVQKKD